MNTETNNTQFGPEGQKLLTPADVTAQIAAAAVRPEVASQTEGDLVAMRTRQQMAVSAADRAQRKEQGLPPPVADLR